MNEHVERIKDIIETSWRPIEERVQELVREVVGSLHEIPVDPQSPELATLRQRLDEAGRQEAGFNYATCVRLKISGVVDRYAGTAYAACGHRDDDALRSLRAAPRRGGEAV